ncbi:MAG: hypothetical protein KatS3mg033_1883 [Thermonema sp.]|nr:MAG: hypothetical protein KatS3mg033_1883 [Thermonema sp.]
MLFMKAIRLLSVCLLKGKSIVSIEEDKALSDFFLCDPGFLSQRHPNFSPC